jgi:hypothetical protein
MGTNLEEEEETEVGKNLAAEEEERNQRVRSAFLRQIDICLDLQTRWNKS